MTTHQNKINNEYASTYDSLAQKYKSHIPATLFGMCYDYIEPGETLLDLGIGTGLSSINFAKAGLQVYGLDASTGMLEECRKKGFAKELKLHSLEDMPLPYTDQYFSHIISCGVYHFYGELTPFIREVKRMLQPGGIFAFSIASHLEEKQTSESRYIELTSKWNISIFKHSNSYINMLLQDQGFAILKEQRLLSFSGDKDTGDILYKVFIAKKAMKHTSNNQKGTK